MGRVTSDGAPARSSGEPLVGVVTPFYNTERYLAQCIESVLAQTHGNFEYLLVNNMSTDGSREVALRYAAQDQRVRVIDSDVFRDQIPNYNHAIAQLDPRAKYVKLLCADDVISAEFLRRTVEVAERDERIGIVSSYYLVGEIPSGQGVPYGTWRVPGRQALAQMLRDGYFFVGSPTAVLYRGSVVRERRPFYPEGRYHADTAAAYEIMLEHDLGFAHDMLSFIRTDNDSITSRRRSYNLGALDKLIAVDRYGGRVFAPAEFEAVRREAWGTYYDYLGRNLLRARGREFWEYQRGGLATVGLRLRRRDLWPRAALAVVRFALNPLDTAQRVVAAARRQRPSGQARAVPAPGLSTQGRTS